MKILITGASGFVGRAATAALLNRGHQVVALLLPGDETPMAAGAAVVRGDITAPETLPPALAGCDSVVHLAGAVGYGQSWDRCGAINVDGTRNVARAAIAAGARRFLHMSSVSVYGRDHSRRLHEDVPLRKIGEPYGDTKIDAEHLVRGLSLSGDLDLTILRPTVIYGPGDDKFLPKVVENLRSGKARIIGTGRNRVDLVHVDDVVDFVCAILGDFTTYGQAYNLNNPNNGSWRDLLSVAADAVGVSPPSGRLPYSLAYAAAAVMELSGRLSGRPPRLTRYAVRVVGRQYQYPTSKAVAAGFRPRVSMNDGVRMVLGS